MKKTAFTFLLIIAASNISKAQTATAATQLANRIAQRMKDTLGLNQQRTTQVYNINLLLHNQKMQARQQHAGTDSVGRVIQRVENRRDSLYRTVLTTNQYNLYLQKKRNLVNNN
jgi:hypothetical protein